MAEEPVVPAFNKGFDRLIVQLKENSKIEQDEQRRSRIEELKAQNDAVLEAKNAAAATLEELKKLDKNDKENVKRLAEQHQTQKETIQKLEEARNDRKEEYKQGQETKNAILQMNNQTKEDAQTNKDTKSGIQEMKDALEKQKAEIEAQGGVATDSKKYNEAQLDIAQKELDLRKQSAKRDGISKAGQEEINKEDILGDIETGGETAENILDIARIALSAEMLGNSEAAFETTLDYLKQRKQFGVLIGSFQALQHRAAQMFCELELTKSSVMAAMRAADENSNELQRLSSLAKTVAGETLHLVSNEAVQMHGGIGVTDEYDIGFFLKRGRVAEQIYGGIKFHTERYANLSGF